jgi:hypothetical protein
MYSFAQRSDMSVIDEPFYAAYLSLNPHIEHPGKEEVLATQSHNPIQVINELEEKSISGQYLFVKNMAHHCKGYDLNYLYNHRAIFLIRHPALILNSFAKVIETPTASDIGLKREHELYELIEKNGKYKPVVLDSAILLKNPKDIIEKLCLAIDIPFDSSMLHWEARPRKEDGSWAKYWYHNVHKSTGFKKKTIEIPILGESLNLIKEEVMPYYVALRQKAIR